MSNIDLPTDELKNHFHNLENEKADDEIFNSKLQEELFKYSDYTSSDLDEYKEYIGDIKTLHDVSDNDFPHTLMSCMEKGGLVETEYGDNKRSFESDFFSPELIDMLNHPETYKNIHSNRDSMIEMYLEDYWGDSVAKEIEMWASYFDDSGYVNNLIDKAVADIEMRNNEPTFEVTAFYDEKLSGISDRETGLTFDEAVDKLHEFISKGGFVQVRCDDTGVDKVFSYDEYFENFEGESPLRLDDFKEMQSFGKKDVSIEQSNKTQGKGETK